MKYKPLTDVFEGEVIIMINDDYLADVPKGAVVLVDRVTPDYVYCRFVVLDEDQVVDRYPKVKSIRFPRTERVVGVLKDTVESVNC